MNDDLKNLEAALASAVQAAVRARRDLNAARSRAGLDDAEPQFYTAAQWRARDEQERQNYRAVVDTARIVYRPTKADQEYDTRMKAPETARDRAQFAWLDTLARADAIIKEREAEKKAAAKAATVTATAADIVRAGAVRRGEVAELPTSAAARAIIAAGRKARNDERKETL